MSYSEAKEKNVLQRSEAMHITVLRKVLAAFKGTKLGRLTQHLGLLHLPQPPHGRPDGGCGGGGVSVGTSCHLDSAVLVVAEPDAGGLPLHLVLATEGAQVLRVLRDLHLLDGLPQGSTIPGAVLSSDSNLLGALRHLRGFFSCRSESSNKSLVHFYKRRSL